MFDIGFAEMLIIGVVALLVIGPERLPTVARQAGIYVGKIKRFVSSVRTDVEREFRTEELQRMLQEQQTELQSLKNAVNETRKEADLGSIEQSIRETGDDLKADLSAADDKAAQKPKPAAAADTDTP